MEPSSNTKKVSDPAKWKPGKYKAKAIDWMVTKTQAGLPQVSILFSYEQQGDMPGTTEQRELTWYGSFKEKALERTMEVLKNLGLRQPPYPAMEMGREGKALDENVEVEVVVEHRANQDGKVRAGISWVNRLGGRGLESKLEGNEGERIFADVNAAYAAYMAKEGITVQAPAAGGTKIADQIAQGKGNLGDDDIPF